MLNCFKKLDCYSSSSNKRHLSELATATDKTPPYSLDGLVTNAKCTKCYDADTVHLVFHHQNILSRWTGRLIGIDSAEIKSKDGQEHDFAIKSRDYLKNIILDKIVSIKCGKFDKYGRLLVTISYNGQNINELLLKEGYAYEYRGATKVAFTDWHKGK